MFRTMNLNLLKLSLIILFLLSLTKFASGQDLIFQEAEYQSRLSEYRQTAIDSFRSSTIPIQAFLNLPVDDTTLSNIIENINTNEVFDFNLVQLIRILYFSNGEYDDYILSAIQDVPMWLTPNETTRVYWSENHITMWLSSAWLLKEKYNIDNDRELRKKLIHCLDLKLNYGFYEFFSSVYFPYTLSGLLNLVDFSQDEEIKQKATLATHRLLKDVLQLVNNKGVFFPAAGRNYEDKYESAYGQNHSDIIYLLTGLGEKPKKPNHAGAFLSTSSLDVHDIVNSWSAEENTMTHIGHNIQDLSLIHQDLQPIDKVIFQWSGGAYFHPQVAQETANLLENFNLWNHQQFKSFSNFKGIPASAAPIIANLASSLSYSSVISKADVAIYKNHAITLSSIQNYWKGRAGYQQWPWAANTGTIGVSTQSGDIYNLLGEENLSGNSNLPYIEQNENVALIMYRPKKDLPFYGFKKHDVRLLWELERQYDEVVIEGKWIIGREGDSYIAVLRHCTDSVNDIYACDDQDGQLWACVVGNETLHESFNNFINIIRSSKYQEKWNYVFDKMEWHYYGMIEVDGKRIEHNWVENLLGKPDDPKTDPIVTHVQNILNENVVNIYPNPVNNLLSIVWKSNEATTNSVLKVVDISGRIMWNEEVNLIPNQRIQLSVENWNPGVYQLLIYTPNGVVVHQMVIH